MVIKLKATRSHDMIEFSIRNNNSVVVVSHNVRYRRNPKKTRNLCSRYTTENPKKKKVQHHLRGYNGGNGVARFRIITSVGGAALACRPRGIETGMSTALSRVTRTICVDIRVRWA